MTRENCEFVDVIMVIYNKSLSSVSSLSGLLNSPFVSRVVICDNSDRSDVKLKNSAIELDGLLYLDMKGNQGISKAYNAAIAQCASDYICLFDDDTLFPDDYFQRVKGALTNDPKADVLLPLVVSSADFLMSPCQNVRGRILPFKKPYDFKGSVSAINSGMIISRTVFQGFRYDEKLFLDNVDHDFMDYARSHCLQISIMNDVTLRQEYSREAFDRTAERSRFSIWRRDNRRYYTKKSNRHICLGIKMEIERRLYLKRKYNAPSFMWIR